jgi:hypothetical protein
VIWHRLRIQRMPTLESSASASRFRSTQLCHVGIQRPRQGNSASDARWELQCQWRFDLRP